MLRQAVTHSCAVLNSGVGSLSEDLGGGLEGFRCVGGGALILILRKSRASSSMQGELLGSFIVGESSSISVCSSSVGMEPPLASRIGRLSSAW